MLALPMSVPLHPFLQLYSEDNAQVRESCQYQKILTLSCGAIQTPSREIKYYSRCSELLSFFWAVPAHSQSCRLPGAKSLVHTAACTGSGFPLWV